MNEHSRIASMPKVEQHLHLEGSLRPETVTALALRHNTTVSSLDTAGFTDFNGFLRAFLAGLELLRTAEDFADITEALARELAGQNVIYAEVTTTPFNHSGRGVSLVEYADGLTVGRRRANALGVDIGWIFDIPRELEPPDSEATAKFILGPHCPVGVVGIGLGGPENGWPAERFETSFRKVRAAGLASLPHAGETDGPQSVWAAVETLAADRIGHGIRSVEDPRLLTHLASEGLPLEISITSNVRTGVVPSVAEHPIRRLAEAGVTVTVNTDDPAYFYTDLNSELIIAREIHGFTVDELAAIQRDALASSFCDAATRTRFDAAMLVWEKAAATGT